MNPNLRILLRRGVTAAALALTVGIPAFGRVSAAPAVQREACSIQYIYGHEDCFAPASVASAERQVPFAVRPSAAVGRVLGLRLSQVGVWRSQPGGARRELRIEYIYGALVPGGDYGRAPAQPKSVVVREDRGLSTVGRPARYARLVCGTTMNISPATLGRPAHSFGPWFVIANFPHHNATLSIVANVGRPALERLACGILAAG